MIFDVDDPALIKKIQALVTEFNHAKSESMRISNMSYSERLHEFLQKHVVESDQTAAMGFRRWYKNIPIFATFGYDLGGYFGDGEDVPCFMRGSIYVMKIGGGKCDEMACRVFDRFIRRYQITCLSLGEWHEMCESKKGVEIRKRIAGKWVTTRGLTFTKHVEERVSKVGDDLMILISGKQEYFSEDQIALTVTLIKSHNKLLNLEKTYQNISRKARKSERAMSE